MSIGENIKQIRQEKGLSQKKLGELSGIAEPTIRRYETGSLHPKLETVDKIATALGVSSYTLIGTTHFQKKYPHMTEGKKELEGLTDFLNSIGYVVQDKYLPDQDSEEFIELIKDGKSITLNSSEFYALLQDTKDIVALRLWQKTHFT